MVVYYEGYVMEKVKTTQVTENNKKVVDSPVAEEFPLIVVLEEKKIVTLLCTPADLENLVRGFLFTSGVIAKVSDIRKIVVNFNEAAARVDLVSAPDEINISRIITSSGGREFFSLEQTRKMLTRFKIKSSNIYSLMKDFLKGSMTYLKTGGVHSAALIDGKKIMIFKEDIGRHNAIDKVIGEALFKDISLRDKALMTTGRVSSEIIAKMQRCGIPVIISKSAPTNQAVRFSDKAGITLIGFVRKSSMNIYSYEERVLAG